MERPILKSPQDIEKMRVANRIVAQALRLVETMAVPGVSTWDIDQAVEKLIVEAGAVPVFKNYPSYQQGVAAYPASICASLNEEVVHGIPSKERVLTEGQILSVDIGAKIDGFCGDAARTFGIGAISKKAQKLLAVTSECLHRGISAIRPGCTLRDIAHAVQQHAERNGFSVVKQFVGHGIGREMHEPPQVPNYVARGDRDIDQKLLPGSVLAIEPMVNVGGSEVLVKADGWTVITRDRSLSAHFENTVAITENGPLVLSIL